MAILDDTPAAAIARLDASLARRGQDVQLQRATGITNGLPTFASVTCRARVRNYAPAEVVQGILHGESHVVLSPSEIIAGGWTSGRPAGEDGRVPMANNRVVIAGRARIIKAAVPFYMAGELVRIELQVQG